MAISQIIVSKKSGRGKRGSHRLGGISSELIIGTRQLSHHTHIKIEVDILEILLEFSKCVI